MKYYIRRTIYDSFGNINRTDYKHYKCIDGFCTLRALCWKFSYRGARGIIKRLEEEYKDGTHVRFDMIQAEEA